MEYLLVKFPEFRPVVIDGIEQGVTNQVIELPKGTYTVSLTPSDDLKVQNLKVRLSDTSSLAPKVVKFAKKK